MAHPEDREGSGVPSKVCEDSQDHPVVQEATQRCGRGREAHLEVWEGSECLPIGPGGVGMSTRRSGRGQKVHPEVWEGSGGPP